MVDKNRFGARQVLTDNLKALMKLRAGPTSQTGIKKRSGPAQATVGRILNKAGGENSRIETVERIAKAYGLEAWQLLVPGMNPSNPPVLLAASKEEKALYERLRATAEEIAKLKQ
jgi:hypothetical protein